MKTKVIQSVSLVRPCFVQKVFIPDALTFNIVLFMLLIRVRTRFMCYAAGRIMNNGKRFLTLAKAKVQMKGNRGAHWL